MCSLVTSWLCDETCVWPCDELTGSLITNDRLTATDHVTELLTSCSRLLYVMRAHGLPLQSLLQDVFSATVEAKLIYAAPAWSGFCSAWDRVGLNAFLRRCAKLGHRGRAAPNINTLFTDCDEQFLKSISYNSSHNLQQYVPDKNTVHYSLRTRSHNKALIPKAFQLNERNFFIRNLYKIAINLHLDFYSAPQWRNSTCDCSKIYHITIIVCAPYFVNLNNNTFQLKMLLFFVHLRLQQKRTEKVLCNYLFKVFRALTRSVEWSGVSGVDSPDSPCCGCL